MKIQSTALIKEHKIKIIVSGESGVGKTTLLGTTGMPTLVISLEGGLLSLSSKQIDYIDCSKNDSGEIIPTSDRIERLGLVFEYLKTKEAKEKYKCIAIDSLTEISQCLVDSLKEKYPDKSDSFVLYGENADKMRGLIKAFRDLPDYHVIVVALTKTDKDENGKRFITTDIIGKMSEHLPAFFDEVFYLEIFEDEDKKPIRVLITGATAKFSAKDRSGKLNLHEPADLSLIFNKILETTKNKKEK